MSTREAYQMKLEAQLDEWNTRLDGLKAEADQLNAESRIAYSKKLDELKEKQQAARTKLDELRQASDGSWEGLKNVTGRAWKELHDEFESVPS